MSFPSNGAPAILVVDDNPANLLAVEAVLGPLGYPLVLASSGEEALRRASAEDFVLVLMDVHMPGLDGYQTTERLRRHERSREVPVIFLTAVYNQPEHQQQGYALGAADYISKPFDAQVLRAKVRALISLYVRGQTIERVHSEKIDRVKDLFLGTVGHDLRNPLGTITMAAKLLGAPTCPDAKRITHAARIDRAAARMNRMIEDILDLTRGQFMNGIPVTLAWTDLAEVCRAVVAEFRLSHPNRIVELDVVGNLAGQWDAGRLSRLLSNLVGNAIQHTEAAVLLRTRADHDDAVLTVHNPGAPIAPEILPRLFEPFRRGDTSSEGLGLGLYIVREIVRAHGGSVTVTSTAADGTAFTVRLPTQPSPRAGATAASEREDASSG